eukprot:m51a1_g13452 hypothetical protein (130) ;mRNA; r:347-2256
MPVSAHMDRATASLPKMQLNFHNFICFPLFQVVVPWRMARSAGFASIRAVAEPLLEKIATASQIQVLEFLHTAEAATLEATETLSWLRPPGNLTFELELFHRIGMRVSPEMRLRYIALGYEDGRMSASG